MNKPELVDAIAKKLGISKAEVDRFVNGFIEAIEDALLEGNDVKLKGFGNFSVVDKEATTCKNPRNPQEVIEVPAKKVVKFKLSKKLKDLFNDK